MYTSVYDALFDQVPPQLRDDVLKLLVQSNASPSQRRQLLIEKGLTRNFVDCTEVLADGGKLSLNPDFFSVASLTLLHRR